MQNTDYNSRTTLKYAQKHPDIFQPWIIISNDLDIHWEALIVEDSIIVGYMNASLTVYAQAHAIRTSVCHHIEIFVIDIIIFMLFK